MPRFGQRNVNSRRKKSCGGFLVLMVVGSIMLGCLIATDVHSSSPTVSANPNINGKASGSDFSDPTANLNGFHLYDVKNMSISTGGTNLSLSYPTDWKIMGLGLNFFNGTLVQNTTTGTSSEDNFMTDAGSGYEGYITGLKIPGNSTIYQAQFNITEMKIGSTGVFTTVNELSNSSYPAIDGNVGIAQRFSISNHALNLTIQVRLMRIEGTARNLTVELRSSTSDNKVGGLIRTASYAPTTVGTGSAWVSLTIPGVNLNPGYYFIVLHTDNWLGSGGGYRAETTLSKRATTPSPGWVSFDRGVNWQNFVNLTSTSSDYFGGFKLRVCANPPRAATNLNLSVPSDLNLKINSFQVADNFIWNQSAGSSGTPPYWFKVTSDYPILALNLTYKAWIYTYGANNLLNATCHIMVNGAKNTTAITPGKNFTMMYVNLDQTDANIRWVDNPIALTLQLFSGGSPINGNLSVAAWAWLTTSKTGLSFSGSSSLKLAFDYGYSVGSFGNVTFAETAMTIGQINSQIDNLYVNDSRIDRNLWSYDLRVKYLFIYREAFAVLPQFTLVNGSLLNITVFIFNNFTATVNASFIDSRLDPDGPTPIDSLHFNSSIPLLDLDGLSQVNITVTSPDGDIINNSVLTPTGGPYVFDWTLTEGAGVYGLKITSNDSTGNVATRWIGAATVDDFVLAPPKIMLEGANGQAITGNLTSEETALILANISYVDHADFTFDGTVNITIYLGGTGEVDHLAATWNATSKAYSATYNLPSVDSPTLLTIYVEAVDLKGRISANSTFTYLEPHASLDIPQREPSLTGILELLFVAMVLLIPLVAYIVEKRRKAK